MPRTVDRTSALAHDTVEKSVVKKKKTFRNGRGGRAFPHSGETLLCYTIIVRARAANSAAVERREKSRETE